MGSSLQHSVPNATLHLGQPTGEPGASGARFWDFDDEVIRLVKWHPSVHGITSTYSELIASRLGQLFDAPVIRGTVVHIDPELLPPETVDQGAQPFHVGFAYLEGSDFRDNDFDQIDNQLALPRAVVQLAWLQVADQEGHNQYLYRAERFLPDGTQRKMKRFVVIDQAAIFGSHNWSSQDLQPSSEYMLPASLRSRVGMKALRPIVEELLSVEEGDIRACFDSRPDDWEISDELVSKGTDFVLERRQHLETILKSNFAEES